MPPCLVGHIVVKTLKRKLAESDEDVSNATIPFRATIVVGREHLDDSRL